MRLKFYLALSIFVSLPFFAFADETLTITTYYPSPYGSYNQLTVASNTYLAYSSGNVGIGTSNPGCRLDITTSGSSGVPRTVTIRDSSQTAINFGSYPGDWTAALAIQNNNNSRYIWINPMAPNANANSRIFVFGSGLDIYTGSGSGTLGFSQDTSGNVGIGTSSPNTGKLVVSGAYPEIVLDNPSAGAGTMMKFFDAGTEKVRIGHLNSVNAFQVGDSSNNVLLHVGTNGNIGIDTTTINNRLQLSSGSNSTGMQFNISGYPSNWGSRIFNQDCYNGACNGVDLAIEVETSNTWYSAVSFGHGQDVNHPSLKAWYSAALATTSGNVSVGVNSTSYKFQVYIDGSNEGHVDSTGAWARSSDTRFKKNVSDLKDGLNKIMKLRAVRYDSKTDLKAKGPGKHLGFIGQEMEKVIPELVSTDNRGYKSIAYGDLTIVLTKAVQEQQKEIDDLKSEIQKLKKEIK